MYNIENCFAVLENVAGFARLDVYIYVFSYPAPLSPPFY